jgi:Xaa-Pro aminopeptidase
LGFDRLTHIPIQKKLIDVSLLTDKEIAWINQYHADVLSKVGPLMITDLGRKWLKESTNPLVKTA